MRILVAMDKLRGSMSAVRATAAVARGLRRARPGARITTVPVADGGEGTLEALAGPLGLAARRVRTLGPLGERRRVRFGLSAEGLAVAETARTVGLGLIAPERRDPGLTGSAGVGRLLRGVARAGARSVLVGLGGSATVDGGAGALAELGADWRDARGRPVATLGRELHRVASVDLAGLDRRVAGMDGVLLCDVANPLLGPEGAAARFGPQKGASPATVRLLERGLRAVAAALRQARPGGRRSLDSPGSGAAGGLGAGLGVAFGWPLRPGAAMVLESLGFAPLLRRSDLVVCGEGRWDGEVHPGKAAHEVARRAKAASVPVVVLAGRVAAPAPEGGEAWDGRVLPDRPDWLSPRDLEALGAWLGARRS
jgi:glycerate kinase